MFEKNRRKAWGEQSTSKCNDLVKEMYFNVEENSLLSRAKLALQNAEINRMKNSILD